MAAPFQVRQRRAQQFGCTVARVALALGNPSALGPNFFAAPDAGNLLGRAATRARRVGGQNKGRVFMCIPLARRIY